PGARPAAAPAPVRDLRVLAPGRGRPPAGRPGQPGRPAVVGPAGGLPHRGPRPHEGSDGEERRHRARRRQGRLRHEAAAGRRRSRRGGGRGGGLLPGLRLRLARRDRQHRRRGGRPPAGGLRLRRRRPLPGGGGRQGHGDVLRPGQLDRGRVRLLARRRLRLGRFVGLRPQEDGDHRPGRLGIGEAPLPRLRRRRRHRADHGGGDRRHVGRRVRQRDALLGEPAAGGGLRPPPRLRRPEPRPRTQRRRTAAPVPSSAFVVGRLWAGGGVFPRTAKAIPLSPEARAALGTDADVLRPAELIKAVLRAPVDLLWNGGIGTYVKASSETHADAGDKANDAVRIDAGELRARVVGEGGNLGFTQRARIEYALAGGRINTDAIDNSAGVDCSDHEVNIKILLDTVVADGEMTVRQRDRLLAEMTDEVAAMVLRDNYDQTGALAVARAQAAAMVDVHARYLRKLESEGSLDRAIEFLPSDDVLAQRRSAGTGLTTPEFAVLLAYTKLDVSHRLLASDACE